MTKSAMDEASRPMIEDTRALLAKVDAALATLQDATKEGGHG